jgi:hypothetical protein
MPIQIEEKLFRADHGCTSNLTDIIKLGNSTSPHICTSDSSTAEQEDQSSKKMQWLGRPTLCLVAKEELPETGKQSSLSDT